MMAGEKFLSNHDSTQERKRGKREPDARTRKILRQVGSDPGAQCRPCLHDQSNHDIDIPVHRVSDGTVTGGNDDLE